MLKRPRQHNEKHLDFIRSLPCLSCLNPIETQAAHIRFGAPWVGKRHLGKGEKSDDLWTVPLCGRCHAEQHEVGEATFWRGFCDPLMIALALWAHTGQHEVGEMIVRAAHE